MGIKKQTIDISLVEHNRSIQSNWDKYIDFLTENTWHIDDILNLVNNEVNINYSKVKNRAIHFNFNNQSLNQEIKYLFLNNILNEEWSLVTVFKNKGSMLKKLAIFMNSNYPSISSFTDININKADLKWLDWLTSNDVSTTKVNHAKDIGKTYRVKNEIGNFVKVIYKNIISLKDSRNEFEKDVWDVRNLQNKGIKYNMTSNKNHYIHFENIKHDKIKNEVKRYIKERLLSNNNFSWSTACSYMGVLPMFINFVLKIEPSWDGFKNIKRIHIEQYIEYINSYTSSSLKQYNSNPKQYKRRALNTITKFLSEIQQREYDIAPIVNIRTLIYASDIPSSDKKSNDSISYIPDIVIEQLFENINKLKSEIVPVVWIMYKTGLRISDALCLNHDCLIKMNNSFWIETDIEKTYVKSHRIPIDNELADMISVLINNSILKSTKDNNPNKFIFTRYSGKRAGLPYDQKWIQSNLNILARECNIVDEMGKVYHFKNHAFRHTYAVKMLNGGADILTVQELLAHASPEMTMRYAKLLDDTKRKVFDNAVKQGVFSFDENTQLKEESENEISTDILDMLWTNHKLNAMDTPYGTCLQRANGRCSFAKQPPCLTCNGGKPCRDLCVGAFEGDINKYEILITSVKSMIENAKIYNRLDTVKENEEILSLYENIHETISSGNIVYSRLERLKKKGDTNE